VAIKIKKKKTAAVEEVDPILEQDQFLQTSDKSISWAAKNRQKVVIVVVAIAAIALAGVFLAKYSEKNESERVMALSEAVSAHPNDNVAGPARLIKARGLVGLGKYEEAGTLYKEWLDAHPDAIERPIVLQAMASAQAAAGKSDAAVTALESLVLLDKKTYGETASYQIGQIYDSAGNKEKAKQQYDAFIKDYPESGKLELVKLRREAL